VSVCAEAKGMCVCAHRSLRAYMMRSRPCACWWRHGSAWLQWCPVSYIAPSYKRGHRDNANGRRQEHTECFTDVVGERTPYALEARVVDAWLRPRVEVRVYAQVSCVMTVVDAGVLEAAGWDD
jgi:hypothetical protein